MKDVGATTTFVVVRHAEKGSDDARDPSLSEAGKARAQNLAQTAGGRDLGRAPMPPASDARNRPRNPPPMRTASQITIYDAQHAGHGLRIAIARGPCARHGAGRRTQQYRAGYRGGAVGTAGGCRCPTTSTTWSIGSHRIRWQGHADPGPVLSPAPSKRTVVEPSFPAALARESKAAEQARPRPSDSPACGNRQGVLHCTRQLSRRHGVFLQEDSFNSDWASTRRIVGFDQAQGMRLS